MRVTTPLTNASRKRACAYCPINSCAWVCTFAMRCLCIKKELSAPLSAPENNLSFYFRTLNSLFDIKFYSVVNLCQTVFFE